MRVSTASVSDPTGTRRYTYRARTPRPAQAAVKREHANLTRALGVHKQLLSHASSAIRTLTAARNEMIAQALEDGLTLATIAGVTGESIRAVRNIGLAYDDLHASGLPRNAQLDALKAKSEELKAAERHRDQITERREALIVIALQNQVCDDLELASLTGLTQDHIRRSTRGLTGPA